MSRRIKTEKNCIQKKWKWNLEKKLIDFIGPQVLADFMGVLYLFYLFFTDLMNITTYYLIIDWNNNG